jgi:TPR repeat protein
MARFEIPSLETAQFAGAAVNAELYFEMGIQYSSGRGGLINLIEAHKWFNIAASRGNRDAVRMRGEIAAEMSAAEIAEAQRAARAFLSVH